MGQNKFQQTVDGDDEEDDEYNELVFAESDFMGGGDREDYDEEEENEPSVVQ